MTDSIQPRSHDQLRDAVAWAAAQAQPLDLIGSGTKHGLGRPSSAKIRLHLEALSGVVTYEPEELVLTAQAGTPMAEIEAVLSEKRQMLAFEPRDLGAVLGEGDGWGHAPRGTLGGTIAANLAGPRRITAGSARDHLLGFKGVSGRGEGFKAGGRVVKNVTGFDLSKLMAGSFGTLAVLTEVTVRVLPRPESTRTVLIHGLRDHDGVMAMTRALQTPFEVSGAAHLPPSVAARSALAAVRRLGGAITALRLEGPAPSVEFRAGELRAVLAGFGSCEDLGDDSQVLWQEIRDLFFFIEPRDRPLWRLSVPPAAGASVAAPLAERLDAEVLYDWGGGLIWLALPPQSAPADTEIRAQVAKAGGHATLVRAAVAVRASVPVFSPQGPALAELTRRVKDAFDPKRILNPGRMYADV